ncbi:hypothetical protein AALP_AA6G228000 [Arabis alpina]|uniref:Uncharacterized protein n=1 Tax=Arabis alpina TaxID=50452 RepID=A0A087GR28_ARAAL|nr:hypothetical protein AALP_AA6G228000 [Arabis alpina]
MVSLRGWLCLFLCSCLRTVMRGGFVAAACFLVLECL